MRLLKVTERTNLKFHFSILQVKAKTYNKLSYIVSQLELLANLSSLVVGWLLIGTFLLNYKFYKKHFVIFSSKWKICDNERKEFFCLLRLSGFRGVFPHFQFNKIQFSEFSCFSFCRFGICILNWY